MTDEQCKVLDRTGEGQGKWGEGKIKGREHREDDKAKGPITETGKSKRQGQRGEGKAQRGKTEKEHKEEGKAIPEVDFEPVREKLFVAVRARDFVWQAVLAKLILHNGVRG